MSSRNIMAFILLSGTFIGGVVYAADAASTTPAETESNQQAAINKNVDKDVGRLSKDGAQAFNDVEATRLAIFNAQPDKAKSLIHKAKDELEKASKEDAVLMKAESELSSPGKINAADAKIPSAKPIAWLPVDSQMTLTDDFKATPEKMAAINDANQSLKKADRKGALEKLALADVNVEFVTEVLPLDKTIADVDKAATLIDQGKYYEANAVLKDSTDHDMLNIVDIYGQPYKAKAQKTNEAKTPDVSQNATSATK